MNQLLVGKYIQSLRKQKQLSQKELAEKLGISFQAVSKWENGETLPDVGILLNLADVLDTTVDKILNGGRIVVRNTKQVNIPNILEGLRALENLGYYFGRESTFYRGAIEGINQLMNIDFEDCLKDAHIREVLLSEAIIQQLMSGYSIDEADLDQYIKSERMRETIKKYIQ